MIKVFESMKTPFSLIFPRLLFKEAKLVYHCRYPFNYFTLSLELTPLSGKEGWTDVSSFVSVELIVTFAISAKNYTRYLEGNDSIRIHASVNNSATKQFATGSDIIDILKPDIEFTDVASHVITDREMKLTVSFTNPLEIPLTGCEAYIGGSMVPKTIYDFKIE